jgi:large conductance mechanosensitive channel
MAMLEEFKKFVMRGTVVDLAVGVVIGAAFGKIVDSLVKDIIMPPIGWLIGNVKFESLSLKLKVPGENPATNKPFEPVEILYGKFLQTTFDFLIIAFCLFMFIKLVNRLQKKKEEVPPPPPASEVLLAEIRDLLKKK